MRERGLWVPVWDGPIRLFHWGVVALVFTSWLTQYEGWMQAHEVAGYTTFAALLFRLAWGVVGSDTARFRSFLANPVAALAHLRRFARREPDREIGHNAAGGWMVLVLLLLLAVQVGTGLCANDEVSMEGPLAHVVGSDASNWLSHVHAVNFKLIEAAIVLHLLAIATYRLLGHDLVRPMLTGRKRLPATMPAPRLVSPLRGLTVFLVAAAAVALGVRALGG
jgi:cytochrome b